jgi:PhnB protein
VRDPLGNLWWIQERVEEPTPDEMASRYQDPRFTEAMRYLQSTLASGLDAS